MALSTTIRNSLNRILGIANVQLETRTRAEKSKRHLRSLEEAGHFEACAFPVLPSFHQVEIAELLNSLNAFQQRFDSFLDPALNDVRFSYKNEYFRSPDAEIFYTLIRSSRPRHIIEIGSGNSTKVARQAVLDGRLKTKIVSIDPRPRADIDALVDECQRNPVENVEPEFFDILKEGDILFVDSSHQVRLGNDCAYIYSVVLPRLTPGALVQIHDIFLPYDYPSDLLRIGAAEWNEQYLVQAMLASGTGFEVIWPGYFLQKTRADFSSIFPHNQGERAQSLWLRKTALSLR